MTIRTTVTTSCDSCGRTVDGANPPPDWHDITCDLHADSVPTNHYCPECWPSVRALLDGITPAELHDDVLARAHAVIEAQTLDRYGKVLWTSQPAHDVLRLPLGEWSGNVDLHEIVVTVARIELGTRKGVQS